MIRVAVCGAAGRMGRALVAAVQTQEGVKLAAATEYPQSSALGADAGELAGIGRLGVMISPSLADVINDVDVVIDFSTPAATVAHAQLCQQNGVAIVIGTTGFSDADQQALNAAAQQVPLVCSGNYSVGVNVTLKLLALAAKTFGDTVDIDVLEAHHRHKVDAPSGTALMMGQAVADALGRDLKEDAVYAREGHTGPRDRRSIGFQTLRGGDTVGDHTVFFFGEGERVEVRHVATNRANFAHGAVRAAAWAVTRQPGRYDMQDVLGLK
ncbi:MAG: 4-hydroxy-tetrahydrodipicolinate reductase [Moraxellaceae bacterium]|nr:4-hydroxy-tetrahydrodipicolinate reductase [Moraxellaceae bacterium]MDZ4386108.1 4-hydroxy-tetrahydrodipicolinate reductase [Moraxellaceae bacterium]